MKALQLVMMLNLHLRKPLQDKVGELEGDGIQNKPPKKPFILNMKTLTRILTLINTFKKLSNGKFEDNGILKAMENLVMMEKEKTFEGDGKQQTFKPEKLELVGRIDNPWW
jgi:hypothetical protein